MSKDAIESLSVIEQTFQPIYGKIGWNVKRGVGSFLTFEFGAPHLEIHEPTPARQVVAPLVRRQSGRRTVTVHGDWHLWVYCCDWRCFYHDTLVGDSNASPEEIDEIARDLNGQALVKVKMHTDGCTRFDFDLGSQLVTSPNLVDYANQDQVEQWLLYTPGGKVLGLSADGRFSFSDAGASCIGWR